MIKRIWLACTLKEEPKLECHVIFDSANSSHFTFYFVWFRKAVMIGGLLSTTLLGTIIDKKDLYAKLAAESYADMADDPEFWKQMTEGMSPEEKEKAKELMERIKADKEGRPAPVTSLEATATTSDDAETSSLAAPTETPEDEAAKASNDMFSDY